MELLQTSPNHCCNLPEYDVLLWLILPGFCVLLPLPLSVRDADEVMLTITSPFDSVVYLWFWSQPNLTKKAFTRWVDYSEWMPLPDVSVSLPDIQVGGWPPAGSDPWEGEWFARPVPAAEDLKLYGPYAGVDPPTAAAWPYFVFVCPRDAAESLAKTPLPSEFAHGASLVGRCWDERYRHAH